jgi:hypothetical protein
MASLVGVSLYRFKIAKKIYLHIIVFKIKYFRDPDGCAFGA